MEKRFYSRTFAYFVDGSDEMPIVESLNWNRK